MQSIVRRKFLGLLAVLPSAAQQAASKMGMSVDMLPVNFGPHEEPQAVPGFGDQSGWLKQQISEFYGTSATHERKERARVMARHLDPDLAALRSVSPAAAYTIQRQRAMSYLGRERLDYLRRLLAERIGG